MKENRYCLTLLLLLLGVFGASAAKVNIQYVNPNGGGSVNVGEMFQLVISPYIDDMSVLRSIPGADVISLGHTYKNINGHEYSALKIGLIAREKGDYKFSINSSGVTSNTVSYKIVGGGAGGSSNSSSAGNISAKDIGKGDGKIFLRATLSRESVYEQEALVYTVRLVTLYDRVNFIGAQAAPSFDGFTVEVINDKSNTYDHVVIDGKQYKTTVIAKYVLFPQVTGKIKVTGNTYTVSVDEMEHMRGPMGSTFITGRPVQLNITPNELTVDVKPLPTPRPANYSGGVGKFSINSSLPNQTFATNQTSTIAYTISGTGNLKYIKMPDLNALYPKQLEVFDPTTSVDFDITDDELSGSVKYDYSFNPTEVGDYTIPDVELVYFNPETGKYETATAQGYKIHVVQGKASDKSQTKARLTFDDTLLPVDSEVATPLVRNFGYWLVYILLAVTLGVILFLYRRRLEELSNLALLRSKKAGSVARKRLKKAEQFMSRKQPEQFYTEMLKALWGFLSDRLHIPQSDLNRDNIRQALIEAGGDEQQCDNLVALLDDCEFAKYAPGAANVDMPTVYERGSQLINHFANTINVQQTS